MNRNKRKWIGPCAWCNSCKHQSGYVCILGGFIINSTSERRKCYAWEIRRGGDHEHHNK